VHYVVIGDIGPVDGMLHVGDEAMFEALVLELRARGVDRITAISSNPGDTAARYGVDAVEGLGFTADRDHNERLLETAPPPAIRAAVEQADAVVVAGGGNMTSIWPAHVYARAALGRLAASAAVPFAVSGQTIGPQLGERDRELVGEMLRTSAVFGVRERDSLALCTSLGGTATLNPDDASFLADLVTTREPLPLIPYALVSLSTHTAGFDQPAFVSAMAELLDEVARHTAVVFTAHFAPLTGPPRGDELMHERVRSAMAQPSGVVRVRDSATSAQLARRAELVISSRYHPVVFAVSGGVPSIGIPVDDYTTTKLSGALGNFGQSSLLPAASLLAGEGLALIDDVWQARALIRDRGIAEATVQRTASAGWWDRVAAL
jgi:polysaccharide pyruvyl transferase WcaK-like protein